MNLNEGTNQQQDQELKNRPVGYFSEGAIL